MNDSLRKNKDGYPLNNIQSNTLKKVIKYFDFHQNDEIKIKEALVADDQEFNNLFMQYNGAPSTSKYVPRQYINDVKKAIEIFDLQFCKSTSLLFNIFECGNILKFNEIVEFAAEHLGNRLQERKPSEIRKALDLTNDWDEEEYIVSF
uniref:Skp1 domain-containing protein n=1 Tax=Rhabditophanes sp. KR3021 TaxID=114890 RepID=A0AC35UAW5_9BILA